MILTPAIEKELIEKILEEPTAALQLPEQAYGAGDRVVVLVEGLPIDLHRHLHNLLIRPLGYHERMWDTSGVPGNVNPFLFSVVAGRKSPRTHCSKGHAYAGNEAPPNSRGYRCRTCLVDSRRTPGAGTANSEKTKCPHGHEYTRKNTIKDADGKRRCRRCKNDRQAAYMRARRGRRTS